MAFYLVSLSKIPFQYTMYISARTISMIHSFIQQRHNKQHCMSVMLAGHLALKTKIWIRQIPCPQKVSFLWWHFKCWILQVIWMYTSSIREEATCSAGELENSLQGKLCYFIYTWKETSFPGREEIKEYFRQGC